MHFLVSHWKRSVVFIARIHCEFAVGSTPPRPPVFTLSKRLHHFRLSARRLTINLWLQNNGSMWKQQSCQTWAWHAGRSKNSHIWRCLTKKRRPGKWLPRESGFRLGASVPARREMPRPPIRLPGKCRMLLPCFRKLDHNGIVRFVRGIKFVIASFHLLPNGKRKL